MKWVAHRASGTENLIFKLFSLVRRFMLTMWRTRIWSTSKIRPAPRRAQIAPHFFCADRNIFDVAFRFYLFCPFRSGTHTHFDSFRWATTASFEMQKLSESWTQQRNETNENGNEHDKVSINLYLSSANTSTRENKRNVLWLIFCCCSLFRLRRQHRLLLDHLWRSFNTLVSSIQMHTAIQQLPIHPLTHSHTHRDFSHWTVKLMLLFSCNATRMPLQNIFN